MIQVEKGSAVFDKWWGGMEIHCDRCRATYKLEDGDEHTPFYIPSARHDEYEFKFTCPKCDEVMELENPAVMEACNKFAEERGITI
jgi:phage FluMu protein Com